MEKGKEISWRYTKYISSNLGGVTIPNLARNEYPKFRLGGNLEVVVSRTKSYGQSLMSLRDMLDFKPPRKFSSFHGSLSSAIVKLLTRKFESLLRSIVFGLRLKAKLRLAQLARRLLCKGHLYDCYRLLKNFSCPSKRGGERDSKRISRPPKVVKKPPETLSVPEPISTYNIELSGEDSHISDRGDDSSGEIYVRTHFPNLVRGEFPPDPFWDEFRNEGYPPEAVIDLIYALRPCDEPISSDNSCEDL